MKRRTSFSGTSSQLLRGLLAPACLLVATGLPAACQSNYHLVDMGTLGGLDTAPLSINAFAQVFGWSQTGPFSDDLGYVQHAFIYQFGSLQDIPPLPGDTNSSPDCLNDLGQALVDSINEDGLETAFVSDGSGVHVIAPLPTEQDTNGYSINLHGQVIGHADLISTGNDRAIFWDRRHGTQEIGTLHPDPANPGQYLDNSQANALNDLGQVAGRADLGPDPVWGYPFTQYHAFTWAPGSRIQDLGTLSPDPANPGKYLGNSNATAINECGWIIGTADTAIPDGWGGVLSHGFVWVPGSGIKDLGTLYPNPNIKGQFLGNCIPYGINNLGQVVGVSDTAVAADDYGDQVQHAFLWTPGGKDGIKGNQQMKDLGAAPGNPLFNSVAYSITDGGVITGSSDALNYATQSFTYSCGTMTMLTFGGSSTIMGVNRLGQCVGYADTANGLSSHAFEYDWRGMRDLGTLGGNNSAALGIDDAGFITGTSDILGSFDTHGFFLAPYW